MSNTNIKHLKATNVFMEEKISKSGNEYTTLTIAVELVNGEIFQHSQFLNNDQIMLFKLAK